MIIKLSSVQLVQLDVSMVHKQARLETHSCFHTTQPLTQILSKIKTRYSFKSLKNLYLTKHSIERLTQQTIANKLFSWKCKVWSSSFQHSLRKWRYFKLGITLPNKHQLGFCRKLKRCV